MAWLKSYRELEHHPKTKLLQQLLGQSSNVVIGQLHTFWWWCLDYAENGRLDKYGKDKIEKILNIEVDKFIEAGFIDILPDLRVHDWYEYVGMFLQTKYKQKPEKWQLVRDYYNGCSNSSKTGSKESQDKIREDKIREDIKDIVNDVPLANAIERPKKPTPQNLLDLWNSKAHPNLPRAEIMTPARKTHINARLVEHSEKGFWEALIERVNRSPLLIGENGRGWKCSFDWILNVSNMAKILEGNYDPSRRN